MSLSDIVPSGYERRLSKMSRDGEFAECIVLAALGVEVIPCPSAGEVSKG
jgi:hypothetical protein